MSQQINLYDPALRPERELLTAARVALVAGVLLVVMGAWGTWLRIELGQATAEATAAGMTLKQLQDESVAIAAEIASRKPDSRLVQELAGARSLLEVKDEVLAVLAKGLGPGSVGFSEYLRGLSRQSSEGLWLTAFSVADNGAAMEIQGRTLNPALLPEYIHRLNRENAFQGRAFSALTMQAVLPPVPAPAAQAAPAAAPPAPVSTTPLYHEFVLVPVKPEAKAVGGGRS